MLRSEATEKVEAVTFRVGPYAAVSLEQAESLLGADRMARLLADPIRKLGPNTEAFYPWNAVDYLAEREVNETSSS